MRQVFLEKGSITVKEVCQPLLDDTSILVSVHYSFVSSGTELASIAQSKESIFTNVPQKIKKVLESVAVNGVEGTTALVKGRLKGMVQQLGYSCSGQVIAVGKKITHIRVGDYVACAGAGFANHADIVCVPENLAVRITDSSYLAQASITTIGAIALQGIRRAEVQLGETVCVIGLGLLGQLTVQLAKLAGCRVIGVDLVDERLSLAKELGADYVCNAAEQSLIRDIAFYTEHHGVDATVITAASKSDLIIQQAMEITRKKGKVVLVGDVGLHLERDPLYKKEIDFLISCSYGPGRYDASYEEDGHDYPYAYVRWTENRNMQSIVSLIESGKLTVDRMVSARTTLHDVEAAYKQLQQQQGLGVILSYQEGKQKLDARDAKKTSLPQPLQFLPAHKESLRIGMIGVGGFTQVKLLPILHKMRDIKLSAIVDAQVVTATNVSRQYGVARVLVDDQELFEKDMVDAVLIASPHKYHCDQTLRALSQGKAVFVEKPMVTDREQLERMRTFLTAHTSIPVCVDYNRSFAPFIQKIKRVIQDRTSPLMIHYRMNAGFIPKEHWIQTEVGAGRLIGEACHIFDLFCFLTDAKPRSVSVESLQSSDANLFPTDNFMVQISFEDGSLCSLMYTSLGDDSLGKERMEVYYDSKVIVMDDYRSLQGYGLPKAFNEFVQTPDKGHHALVSSFFKSLQRGKYVPPISIERLLRVAELTLIIDELACAGGGEKQLHEL